MLLLTFYHQATSHNVQYIPAMEKHHAMKLSTHKQLVFH